MGGAGVVPRDLRDVGLRAGVGAGVGRAPIGGVGAGVGIAEVRAADGDVIGRAGEAGDGDAVGGLGEIGIGAGGTLVPGGDEDGDALGDGGLMGLRIGEVGSGAVLGLRLAVADRDDFGRIAGVDEVVEGDQAAKGGAGVRAGGELDGG